jgi:hypothetical protein
VLHVSLFVFVHVFLLALGIFDCAHIFCLLVVRFRSFNDVTNARVTSGQSFFVVLAMKVSYWPNA